MFKHLVANVWGATCFIVGKLVNSWYNFVFGKVWEDVGIPDRIDIRLGVIFGFPLGIEYVGVDMSRSSPEIKVLLDMGFNSRWVSNNIIVESNIIKFDRIFMAI